MDRQSINSKSFIVRHIGGNKRCNGHERTFNRSSYAIGKQNRKLQTWQNIGNLNAIAKDCSSVLDNVYQTKSEKPKNTNITPNGTSAVSTTSTTGRNSNETTTQPHSTASTSTVTSCTSLLRRVMQANMRICAATSHIRNINRLKIFRFKTIDRKVVSIEANMITRFSNYLRCVQRYRNFRYMKPICLPTIHSSILNLIIEWLEYHKDDDIDKINSRVLRVTDSCTYRRENANTDKSASMRINDIVTETTTTTTPTTTNNAIRENNTQQSHCSDMPNNSSSSSDMNTFSDDKCSEIFSEPTVIDTAKAITTSEAERCEWNQNFLNIELEKLVQLIMAANYLDIESLMSLGITYLSDLMLLHSTQELITLSAINFSIIKANKLEKHIPEVRQHLKDVADAKNKKKSDSCRSLRCDFKRIDREKRSALRM